VAAIMRAPITAVGPLLPTISAAAGLSVSAAGALGMLPLLAFAVASPLAPSLGRRLGLERTLGLALLVLVAGGSLRSVPGRFALFSGTAMIGIGIGLMNVLLAGLIKRDHPARVSAVTGLYTATMGLFAMIGSAIAVPVADRAAGGWRASLGLWAVVALIALLAWTVAPRPPSTWAPAKMTGGREHWRSPLAWQLTAFLGLQAFGFYASVSWLPTILGSHGTAPAIAGWHLALLQLTGLLASASCGPVVRRLADQRLFGAGAAVLGASSYLGFVLAPHLDAVFSATLGLSQGAGITLALSFFALRARHDRDAAALSGMGQSIGYLLAALGPLLVGSLHHSTHSWTLPLVVLASLGALQALLAFGVGRHRYVG
jgi:CP family cyanate transporter-like MFS transporter